MVRDPVKLPVAEGGGGGGLVEVTEPLERAAEETADLIHEA